MRQLLSWLRGRPDAPPPVQPADNYVRRYNGLTDDLPWTPTASAPQLLPFMVAFSVAEPVDGIYEVLDHEGGDSTLQDLFRGLYPERRIHWTQASEQPPQRCSVAVRPSQIERELAERLLGDDALSRRQAPLSRAVMLP